MASELADIRNRIGADFIDEEFHICTSDKCLARTFQHDGGNIFSRVCLGDHFAELAHHGLIQCVHRFRAVQGDGGDSLIDAQVDKIEFKGLAYLCLLG